MLRRVRKISQVELGAAVGVTFQQIQKYEKGANRIGAGRLKRIADVLGVSILHFFVERTETKRAPEDDVSRTLLRFLETNEGRDLTIAFMQISSPLVRRKIADVVKAIAATETHPG